MAINTELIQAFYNMGRARGSGGSNLGELMTTNQKQANELAPQVANANTNAGQLGVLQQQQDLNQQKYQNIELPNQAIATAKGPSDIANTQAQTGYYNANAEAMGKKEPQDKLISDEIKSIMGGWLQANPGRSMDEITKVYNHIIELVNTRYNTQAGGMSEFEQQMLARLDKNQASMDAVINKGTAKLGNRLTK